MAVEEFDASGMESQMSASIVLVGAFNPAIFQPSWLELHRLIRDTEAEAAKISIITAEVAVFSIGDWLLELTRFRRQSRYAAAPAACCRS